MNGSAKLNATSATTCEIHSTPNARPHGTVAAARTRSPHLCAPHPLPIAPARRARASQTRRRLPAGVTRGAAALCYVAFAVLIDFGGGGGAPSVDASSSTA